MSVENPPAFPAVCLDDPCHPESRLGMTLRDWFAGQVVGQFARVAYESGDWSDELLSKLSYDLADAMLAERVKGQGGNAQPAMQHVAYFDDGKFEWMSGIAPRQCELYAPKADR